MKSLIRRHILRKYRHNNDFHRLHFLRRQWEYENEYRKKMLNETRKSTLAGIAGTLFTGGILIWAFGPKK